MITILNLKIWFQDPNIRILIIFVDKQEKNWLEEYDNKKMKILAQILSRLLTYKSTILAF